MPELPEVETVVRAVRPHLSGCRIKGVRISQQALRRPWSPEWEALLLGRRLTGVGRRGKWIILELDRGRFLVFHLGMSGSLTVTDADAAVTDHTHVVIDLGRGDRQLRFRDIRRFGSATLFADRAALDRSFEESGLGPEPWDLQPGPWYERLAATERGLKAVLLGQRAVAGVGNIYADESLFEARLHPTRPGRSIGKAEAERLRRAIVTVLNRAIERGGASLGDGAYLGGSYQDEFRVYRRAGQPCVRCGTPIERIRLAGRSTHFCPRCQSAVGCRPSTIGRRPERKAGGR